MRNENLRSATAIPEEAAVHAVAEIDTDSDSDSDPEAGIGAMGQPIRWSRPAQDCLPFAKHAARVLNARQSAR